MDPRHEKRIKIVQSLFASTYTAAKNNYEPDEDTKAILGNVAEIDSLISKIAPKYPVDKISKTDLAILRLAIYELTIAPREPAKVVINEAVELAKQFGGDKSYAFVNAVLGKVVSK